MEQTALTIDVAHPPRHPDQVESELENAVRTVMLSRTLRAVKVVHGYGSSGKGGTTKDLVRNWAFRRRGRIRGVLHGEDGAFSTDAEDFLKETGLNGDPDILARNRGVTYLWIR
jgi:hypothetical protein